MHKATFVAAALLSASALSAQSPLTTVFASNNGGSTGGAVYFDLTPSVSIEVTSFDLNFGETVGTPAGVTVYVRPGTHVGNEGSPAGWFQVAVDDGTATSQGDDVPTPVPLAAPFCLPGGQTWGVALVAASTVGHEYTNATSVATQYTTAELTLDAGSASNTPFGSVISGRVVNCSVYYNTSPGCQFSVPPGMEAVAEATPNAGTLSSSNGVIADGEFFRWNFTDPGGNYPGAIGITFFNFGQGGSAPIGSTPGLPGFNQVWAGSTPSGFWVDVPSAVGAPDLSLQIPAGVFAPGDTIRIQGIVFDATQQPLPLVATSDTIEYTVAPTCLLVENFDALANGANYPAGWADGGGAGQWVVDDNGTTSSGTGPSAAVSGTKYIYCETSSPATTGDTYILNSAVYSAAAQPAPAIAFQLSRIGATIGTLEVRLDDGSGTFGTLLGTYTGPEPSGAEWTLEVLPLPSPLPANYQIQLHYTRGSSFTGDIAIDDFCLVQ